MNNSRSTTSNTPCTDILLEFLRNEVLDGAEDLAVDTPLLEFGVIDSISMVSVLSFIRERFGVEVRSEEITVKNFRDVMCLANMVEELLECGASKPPKGERARTAPASLM